MNFRGVEPSIHHNGGTAFPIPEDEQNLRVHGMTLRDYFATASITALLLQGSPEAESDEETAQIVAVAAYSMADAMLAERERRESDER